MTVRRVAVLDPHGNAGGGMRFVRRLLLGMRIARPELFIRFVANAVSLERDGIADELRAAGIEVRAFEWTSDIPWESRPLRTRMRFQIRRRVRGGTSDVTVAAARRLRREMRLAASDCDVAYFSWPYYISPPELDMPLVATVHDLNFRYFFGTTVFPLKDARQLDKDIDAWLGKATAVTSSAFMADEIARHFPGHPAVPVVPLAPFAMEMGEGRIPAQHLVEGPYILCATHLAVHKNVGPLLAAHAILRRSRPNLRLVLTGARTHAVTGHATPIGTVRSEEDPDVIGLGYVSNEDIDALIAGAAAVVNPSLYEAGNGPGLDAWSLGTPVAMSDIPAFREHLTRLGVEAAVFDPRSPEDIAAKVASILDDPIRWRESAARSKAAIRARGWEDVAAEYLRVFDSALEDHADP